jgi:hypothetical protein
MKRDDDEAEQITVEEVEEVAQSASVVLCSSSLCLHHRCLDDASEGWKLQDEMNGATGETQTACVSFVPHQQAARLSD